MRSVFVVLFLICFIFSCTATVCWAGANSDRVILSISADNSICIYYNDDDPGFVPVYLHDNNTNRDILLGQAVKKYIGPSRVTWYNHKFVEVSLPHGSFGHYVVYYDADTGRKSKGYWFPIAVDPNREIVVTAEEEVKAHKIFGGFICTIPGDFYDSAAKWLIFDHDKTFFSDDGTFNMRYQNEKFEWVEVKINIDTPPKLK